MKKYLFGFILALFIFGIFLNRVYAWNMYYEPYDIKTRAYDAIYDKQKKLFIIPADKKRCAVKIVFTRTGQIISFNDKVIQYKNGRLSKIGDDYISYLNGKLYTIGGKKVEIGKEGYVTKIGDLTPHQYFIGNDFTQKDVIKTLDGPAGMTFDIMADGTDFAHSFSDAVIYFDGLDVYVGSKGGNNKYTGVDEIKHNCSYKGTPLYGKVRVVNNSGRFKVRKVGGFGDLKVRETEYPIRCGQWKFVDFNEDFTIEYVNASEDFKVEFVKSFEGI